MKRPLQPTPVTLLSALALLSTAVHAKKDPHHYNDEQCPSLLQKAIVADADGSGGLSQAEFATFWSELGGVAASSAEGNVFLPESVQEAYSTILCQCHFTFELDENCCDDTATDDETPLATSEGDGPGNDDAGVWTEVKLVGFGDDARPTKNERHYIKQFCGGVQGAMAAEELVLEETTTSTEGTATTTTTSAASTADAATTDAATTAADTDTTAAAITAPLASQILQAKVTNPYPGYDGDIDTSGSSVTVTFPEQDLVKFSFVLQGVESSCADCGIHIHSGTTCEVAEEVGGHYFSVDVDPWTPEFGAVYNADEKGEAMGSFTLTTGNDTFEENIGHAVVIHGQNGTRVSCGILETESTEEETTTADSTTEAATTAAAATDAATTAAATTDAATTADATTAAATTVAATTAAPETTEAATTATAATTELATTASPEATADAEALEPITLSFLGSTAGQLDANSYNSYMDDVTHAFWRVTLDVLNDIVENDRRRRKLNWDFGEEAAVYFESAKMTVEDVDCPSGLDYASADAPCLEFTYTLVPLADGPLTSELVEEFTQNFYGNINGDGTLYNALIEEYPETPIVGMGSPGKGEPYQDTETSNANQVVLLTSNGADTADVQASGFPVGGIVGIVLACALISLVVMALVVRRRRTKRQRELNDSNLSEDLEANEVNADADNAEVWLDEEHSDDGHNKNKSGRMGHNSPASSLAAMGVASTVATRLSTGDTEVLITEKQAWTKNEPVV